MDCRNAQEEWLRLVEGDGESDLPALARQVAGAFLETVKGAILPEFSCLDLLCEMAVDGRGGRPVLRALYGRIVERFCDDFSPEGVAGCNLVLARMIDFVRRTPQGQGMTRELDTLGFSSAAQLLARHGRLVALPPLAVRNRQGVKKVVILSRVTVGADIVLNSIIVHRLLQALPAAELVVVGPPHLPQIFHGLERVRWEELPYDRNCSFLDRFTVWETLRQLLRREEEGIAPGSLLLVDPDSRLSQLGLLPLLAEESTCYFPSRLNPRPGKNPSLVELVNGWLDGVIGAAGFQSPTVSLPAANIEAAAVFVDKLRASGCRFLIVVNFGVGGDDNKRLGDPFETDLVAALLHGSEDTVILLDSGCACEEKERVLGQLDLYRSQGVATDFVEEGELAAKTIGFAHGIVGFHGSIGGIGSLIGRADGFFGYDSCCQHLAGAVSTPAVIVFAGAPNPRFAARWCPYDATGRNTVLPVADKDALDGVALASLIDRVAAAFAAIRNKEMNS